MCGIMDDTTARGKRRSAYRYLVSGVYLPTFVVTILALSLFRREGCRREGYTRVQVSVVSVARLLTTTGVGVVGG